jgi:hypothetical protein
MFLSNFEWSFWTTINVFKKLIWKTENILIKLKIKIFNYSTIVSYVKKKNMILILKMICSCNKVLNSIFFLI